MSTLQSRDELSWQRVLMRIGIIAICTIVIVIAMPQSSAPQYNAKVGSPWTQTAVTATFDFDIPKDSAVYRLECDSVRKRFAPYYINDLSTSQIQIKRFMARNQGGIDGLPSSYISLVAQKLAELYSVGIIPQTDYARLNRDSSAYIRVVTGKMSQSHRVRNLLTPMMAYEKFFSDSQVNAVRSHLQKCNINEYIVANLKYDSIRSNDELSSQIALIAAKCGQVKKGERIIDRGEIVKDETMRKLNAYSSEMEKHLSDRSKQTTMWGRVMFIAIMLSIFSIYLHLFRADYFEKPRSLAMVYCLIALFPVLVSLMVQYNIFSVYVLPLAMLPMFVRVFLDSRTAFIAHITMVLICSLVLTMPYEFLLIQITSGLVAIYSLRELSKRSQIFTAAVYTSAAALAAHYALQLMQPGEDIALNHSMAIHFVFSGILLLLAYPLMFLVEKVFGFTSSVTLFELSDTNKNLLRRLSEVAPGTLQHSITVGNIGAAIWTDTPDHSIGRNRFHSDRPPEQCAGPRSGVELCPAGRQTVYLPDLDAADAAALCRGSAFHRRCQRGQFPVCLHHRLLSGRHQRDPSPSAVSLRRRQMISGGRNAVRSLSWIRLRRKQISPRSRRRKKR